MITQEAKQRVKILEFWRQYGLKATKDAFGAKRSTLYEWWKIYKESGCKVESLNPKSQAPINKRKRNVHYLIINEIKRLRFDVCPNMGKDKIKPELDQFCLQNKLPAISISTIDRIIKDKKIYHHRQKVSHFGKIKTIKKQKKERKSDSLIVGKPGDLIEIDTIVKFAWGVKRYILTAVDVHSRYSFALAYKKHDSASVKDFFEKLKQVFPYKIESIQTDNGSEFHRYFRDHLKQKGIKHYWNYPGRPYRNGHIEKYNRTIQEEFIDWNESLLEDMSCFNQKLIDWLINYNTKRRHWGLNLFSPVDYLIKNNWVSRMCWTNTKV
jgi:transposase InsO family protein